MLDEDRTLRAEHQHIMAVGALPRLARHEFIGDTLRPQRTLIARAALIIPDPADERR